MEASGAIALSTSTVPLLRLRSQSSAHHRFSVRRKALLRPPRCQKMFVPGFGEASPEAKAAKNLQDFFTYVAVRVVLGQLESYNPEAHEDLKEFMSRNSLNDGDNFCRNLMRESPNHKALGASFVDVDDLASAAAGLLEVQAAAAGLLEVQAAAAGAVGCPGSSSRGSLRIMQVRSAYSKEDFEWDNLKKLAFKMVDESNTRLMREYVIETSHLENDK
ncbi:hypothetical protein QJS04_geneDACA022313 [Acorus gramineus]|uniref:Chaperonin-like RBCX protein 1, chloroplastic n=1 Tax=Acorus gramineus TaxID=55184 RepID=A0AAV9BA36_ACOGR|nr:hypothetical protein QJS04_geneDACA022313 [Acorus gramineus]